MLLWGLLLETKERKGVVASNQRKRDDNSKTIFTLLLLGLLLATKERKSSIAGNQRKGMVIPELEILQIAIFPILAGLLLLEPYC